MVKYIGKSIGFLLGLGILVSGIMILSSLNEPLNQFFAFISCSEEYQRQDVETQTIIDATKTDNSYSKILVGDSVCYLLFYSYQDINDEYLLSGITRPATIATQYAMIKEFLEGHPDAEDVYMMLGGETWRSVIDVQCGYSYFVVTNTLAGTMDNYDAETIQQAENLYGSLLMSPDVVKIFDGSLMNHKIILNGLSMYHEEVLGADLTQAYELEEGISDLSLNYFKKIETLCEENNVKLHLIHDPVPDTEEKHKEIEYEIQMFKDAGLYEKYKEYFDSVLYYPSDYFFDNVHFHDQEELSKEVITDIMEHTGLLDGFNLE